MAQIRSDANKRIADIEAKVKFSETGSVEIVAEGNKNLRDFESGFVQKLRGPHEMYADKVQTIGRMCSLISVEKPSVKDYLNWWHE
jgi:hypothetical protein